MTLLAEKQHLASPLGGSASAGGVAAAKLPAALSLGAWILHFAPGLRWLAGTWTDGSYDSSGFLALPLLALVWGRLPRLRPEPRWQALGGVVIVAALDLFLAPLGINILTASCAIIALHLWSLAFLDIAGRWYLQPQLYVGLAALPVVHWGNVLFGFHLQHAMTRLAGLVLRLYGAAVQVEGTLLRFPSMVVAVDESCSGVRLLAAGLIFGLLARPRRRKLLFWCLLGLGLLVANMTRVVALALLHLWLGGPPSEALHQGVGLGVFALVCAALLWRWRWQGAQRSVGPSI